MLDFIKFWLNKLNPFRYLLAPFGTASNMFTENVRSRGLLLGLPAIVLILIVVLALGWTEFRQEGRLESHYNTMATTASKKKRRLALTLRDELLESAADQTEVEQKERIQELYGLQEQEELYLEKLIALNPDEPDYRYRLAVMWLQKGNDAQDKAIIQKGLALMSTIAPAEEPGYAKAHLFIAQFLLSQKVHSREEADSLRRLALKHTEHCLVRDKDSQTAQLLKAKLYGAEQRWNDAYLIYEKMFESDPQYYQQMIQINRRTDDGESKNAGILSNAKLRFQEMVANTPDSQNQKWSFAWHNLTLCTIQMKQFEAIESQLKDEETRQTKISFESPSFEVSARLAELKKMLTLVYTKWAGSFEDESVETQQTQLDLLTQALSYDNDNSEALRLVSRIATGETEMAARARTIYDPEKDEDAPASVYNDLGSRALTQEKYNLAIKYFELAKRKRPKDPLILNNLAFTYLVCENKDPDLALDLVNKAIRAISSVADQRERLVLASHFYDTRGRALMQMNRMSEAAAAFEMAIQIRPKKKEILEALIKCYEGRDDVQAEVYRRRLAELNNS